MKVYVVEIWDDTNRESTIGGVYTTLEAAKATHRHVTGRNRDMAWEFRDGAWWSDDEHVLIHEREVTE